MSKSNSKICWSHSNPQSLASSSFEHLPTIPSMSSDYSSWDTFPQFNPTNGTATNKTLSSRSTQKHKNTSAPVKTTITSLQARRPSTLALEAKETHFYSTRSWWKGKPINARLLWMKLSTEESRASLKSIASKLFNCFDYFVLLPSLLISLLQYD